MMLLIAMSITYMTVPSRPEANVISFGSVGFGVVFVCDHPAIGKATRITSIVAESKYFVCLSLRSPPLRIVLLSVASLA